jgi:SpoVK/Ycf46/Vps4 family AAA+-type ATPase
MTSDRINALRQALDLSPDNHPLRLMLAEAFQEAGQTEEALQQYEVLLHTNQIPRDLLLTVGALALQSGALPLVQLCLEAARRAGVIEGVSNLQARLDEKMAEQGAVRLTIPRKNEQAPAANTYLEEREKVTFADIGGLDEVKKVIHRMIILPQQRSELYQRYGRQAGGGVMLYGPPGCGKTMLARATAGECNLPFFNVRIEEILDPMFGVSERNLHEIFEVARANAPCVVFFDELDALAFARRKHQGFSARSLVDQMLQELDSIGSENRQVLFLGATNAPWDVDDALLRPGRFDRRIFVPPPDEDARQHILKLMLATVPSSGIDLKRTAKATPLFSGADLRALVDHAVDLVIDEALESNSQPPLTMRHLDQSRADVRPTTLDWLARARNYVEFANQDDRYKEVATFLKSREARAWKE